MKSEKGLLCKDTNFAIPSDKLEYSDYLLPFELLYRDIKDLDLPNEKNNFEKKLTDLLKQLKASEAISEIDYKKLKGSSFGVLYGLCKTHKKVLHKCPPFRPILSAIKTPSYNLAKILVPLFEPITKNNFAVKNSFELSKEKCEQNP